MAQRRFGTNVIFLKESRLDTSSTLLLLAIFLQDWDANLLMIRQILRSLRRKSSKARKSELRTQKPSTTRRGDVWWKGWEYHRMEMDWRETTDHWRVSDCLLELCPNQDSATRWFLVVDQKLGSHGWLKSQKILCSKRVQNWLAMPRINCTDNCQIFVTHNLLISSVTDTALLFTSEFISSRLTREIQTVPKLVNVKSIKHLFIYASQLTRRGNSNVQPCIEWWI